MQGDTMDLLDMLYITACKGTESALIRSQDNTEQCDAQSRWK